MGTHLAFVQFMPQFRIADLPHGIRASEKAKQKNDVENTFHVFNRVVILIGNRQIQLEYSRKIASNAGRLYESRTAKILKTTGS